MEFIHDIVSARPLDGCKVDVVFDTGKSVTTSFATAIRVLPKRRFER